MDRSSALRQSKDVYTKRIASTYAISQKLTTTGVVIAGHSELLDRHIAIAATQATTTISFLTFDLNIILFVVTSSVQRRLRPCLLLTESVHESGFLDFSCCFVNVSRYTAFKSLGDFLNGTCHNFLSFLVEVFMTLLGLSDFRRVSRTDSTTDIGCPQEMPVTRDS
jgi:hypothetical protein